MRACVSTMLHALQAGNLTWMGNSTRQASSIHVTVLLLAVLVLVNPGPANGQGAYDDW